MGNNGSMVMFITVALTVIIGGFVFFYLQFMPDNTQKNKAVECRSNVSTAISFLIDDAGQNLIMAGEKIDPRTIVIFNESAISAKWKNPLGETRIFLDRISGRLDIETKKAGTDWNKEEFDCTYAAVRF